MSKSKGWQRHGMKTETRDASDSGKAAGRSWIEALFVLGGSFSFLRRFLKDEER